MANEVKIAVTLDDKQAVKGLQNIENQAKETGEIAGQSAEKVSQSIGSQTKNTENYLSKMMNFGNRVATSLLNDFKALASINSLQGAMKFSSMFGQSISESVELSDVIRKLGGILGIAQRDFGAFAGNITRDLGDIGLGSQVATNALKGLVDTPVRGEKALIEYSRLAGQLASISMEKGQEGNIAKGISEVIKARGGNVNDPAQIQQVADDVKRVRLVTGKAASETLRVMSDLFEVMPSEMRKKISSRGLANLAAIEQVSGPGSSEFLKQLITKGTTANSVFRSQGFGNVFNDQGLDIEKFRKAANSVLARVGGDTTLAAQTLGISEDVAKGFVRLVENLKDSEKAMDGVAKANKAVGEVFDESKTLSEAYLSNLERIKKIFSEPIMELTNKAAIKLNQISKTDEGAAAVVAGSGILAAVLAGGALKGIGGGLLGGVVKGAAAEKITGKETIPVYVVNAAEIGGLGTAAGALGTATKGIGLGTGLLGAGAAGAAGFAAGQLIEPIVTTLLNEKTTGKTSEGFEGNLLERVFFKLDSLLGGETSTEFKHQQKMLIELKSPELKKTPSNSRGPML